MSQKMLNRISLLLYFLVSLCMPICAQESPAKLDAKTWLQKAETEARRIEGNEEKNNALLFLANAYASAGDVRKAKDIASELQGKAYYRCLTGIVIPQAHAGNIEGALATAHSVSDKYEESKLLRGIGGICALTDISTALEIAEDIQHKAAQSSLYCNIVKNQVLNGDLNGAENTASKIDDINNKDINAKSDAKLWLLAGRLANKSNLNLNDAAVQSDVDLEELSLMIVNIAKARLKAGNLEQAINIIEQIPDPKYQSWGYIKLAEYYSRHNAIPDSRQAIEKALEKIEAIRDDHFRKAVGYMFIARLQVKSGNLDEGLKTIGLARNSGDEETKVWENLGIESGGVFENLGGKKALYQLLILAGKTDEVMQMAKLPDGTISPDAISMLTTAYAVEGKMDQVNEILKTVDNPQTKLGIYIDIIHGINSSGGN